MAISQGVRTPRVGPQGGWPAQPGPQSRRAGDWPRASGTAAPERINVTARFGPLQPAEGESLVQALLLSSQGTAWEDIHRSLVSSQASTRVHIMLRYLLPAIPTGGLEGFLVSSDKELTVQFHAIEVAAIRRLARQLEALRTPFTMTVSFNDRRSGTLRASWELGLDQASIAILGELPPDSAGCRRLLSQMEELLAR